MSRRPLRLARAGAALAVALAIALAAPARADDDDAAALLAKGRERLDAGALDDAVALLRRARDLDADDRDVAEALAVAIARRAERALAAGEGDRDKALGELDEAVRLAPERWDVWALLGVARFGAEDFDGAARALATSVEKGAADQPRVLVWHGHALYRLGRHADAIGRWKEARVAAGALPPEERDPLVEEIDAAVEKARREEKVEGEFRESLSSHFRIAWDGAKDAALGGLVADLLEDAYNTVGYALSRYPRGEVPVVVYSEKDFAGALGAHGWVAGLYDGKIRLPVRGARAEDRARLRAVILHEFTHALLASIARGKAPIWFQEGLAQHFEGVGVAQSEAVLAKMRAAGVALPTFDQLASGAFVKVRDRDRVTVLYAVSHLLVEELLATSGPTAATDYLDALGEGKKKPAEAFERAFGTPLDRFYADWLARR